MEIGGLPLHPLLVHAAVVLSPLAVLLVGVYGLVPRWRWLTRWPAVASAVLAAGSVYAANLSGELFLEQRPDLAPLVETHQQRGTWLLWASLMFLALTLGAAWSLGGPSALISGRGDRLPGPLVVERVMPWLLVLAGVVVLVLVVLTGHSGSQAVWG